MNVNLIFDILNWVAAIASLVSYYLLSTKKIIGFGWTYQGFVFIANVAFILVNSYRETWSFVLMNAVYLIINMWTLLDLYKTGSNVKSNTELPL